MRIFHKDLDGLSLLVQQRFRVSTTSQSLINTNTKTNISKKHSDDYIK
jgi:hypothetical protein